MATLEQSLIYRLQQDATVGAQVGDRIYRSVAPDGATFPFVTYETISKVRNHHLTGSSEITSTLIQFDCIGTTAASAKATAEVLRKNLDALSATTIGNTGLTTFVRSCYLTDERDDFAGPSDGSDIPVYRTSLDFKFWHVETLP